MSVHLPINSLVHHCELYLNPVHVRNFSSMQIITCHSLRGVAFSGMRIMSHLNSDFNVTSFVWFASQVVARVSCQKLIWPPCTRSQRPIHGKLFHVRPGLNHLPNRWWETWTETSNGPWNVKWNHVYLRSDFVHFKSDPDEGHYFFSMKPHNQIHAFNLTGMHI